MYVSCVVLNPRIQGGLQASGFSLASNSTMFQFYAIIPVGIVLLACRRFKNTLEVLLQHFKTTLRLVRGHFYRVLSTSTQKLHNKYFLLTYNYLQFLKIT